MYLRHGSENIADYKWSDTLFLTDDNIWDENTVGAVLDPDDVEDDNDEVPKFAEDHNMIDGLDIGTIKAIVDNAQQQKKDCTMEEGGADLEKQQAEIKAGEVIRSVVDMLSKRQYDKIETAAEMEALTCEDVRELVDGYLKLNELAHIDPFGVKCSFCPKYEYHQMNFYHYNNGSGFKADYHLTTDSELNDLTLQMEFIYEENEQLTARLLDLHVL